MERISKEGRESKQQAKDEEVKTIKIKWTKPSFQSCSITIKGFQISKIPGESNKES